MGVRNKLPLQADVLPGALQELEDDEAGALTTGLVDHPIERVDPLLGLFGIDVGQLVLELVEDFVHDSYGSPLALGTA